MEEEVAAELLYVKCPHRPGRVTVGEFITCETASHKK